MIVFLTTSSNAFTIEQFLGKFGASLAPFVKPATYEEALRAKQFPQAAYVFADLELLTDRSRELLARAWQQLADHGCRVLNHPARTLRRYDLLRLLHERGINEFNVHRVADIGCVERFPVFVRHEHHHTGSGTELLHNAAELAAGIEQLKGLGAKPDELLITEFCATADDAGLYRKYGAFIVGDQIIARHLFFSKSWQVKDRDLLDEPLLLEERQYVATNPHAEQLRPFFAVAHVEYGRIDYSLAGDRIQIWEINTNPIIVGQGTGAGGVRLPVHTAFANQFRAAMMRLDG